MGKMETNETKFEFLRIFSRPVLDFLQISPLKIEGDFFRLSLKM